MSINLILPKTCTDPAIVEEVTIAKQPGGNFIVNARDVALTSLEFLEELRSAVIDAHAPYSTSIKFYITPECLDYRTFEAFGQLHKNDLHSVDLVEDAECIGLCVNAADVGINGYTSGVAYPHPDCPIH